MQQPDQLFCLIGINHFTSSFSGGNENETTGTRAVVPDGVITATGLLLDARIPRILGIRASSHSPLCTDHTGAYFDHFTFSPVSRSSSREFFLQIQFGCQAYIRHAEHFSQQPAKHATVVINGFFTTEYQVI